MEEDISERYELKLGDGEWKSASRAAFISAERRAGFRPKMSSDDPRYMNTLATGGFDGNNIEGRIIQAPADRVADAVRSPEDERTLAQIAYDVWSSVDMADKGVMECWEAAATAVRDKVMEWKTIETAPKDGTEILICGGTCIYDQETYPTNTPFKRTTIASWNSGGEWERDGYGSEYDGRYFHKPTLWMPLPSPPCVPGRD